MCGMYIQLRIVLCVLFQFLTGTCLVLHAVPAEAWKTGMFGINVGVLGDVRLPDLLNSSIGVSTH